VVWGTNFPAPLTWEQGFDRLKKYHTAMGNYNVKIDSKHPNALAKWVSAQRIEYRRFQKGKVRADSLYSEVKIYSWMRS
jgi:hypothetical protein